MFATLRRDVAVIFERDPAARNWLEILTCYPGLHAIWGHRFSHWLWGRKLYWPGRLVSHIARGLTGIEIHPGATIGPGFFIDHGMGIVIGETTEIGPNVSLYHGVTLGGTSMQKGKRHPTLEEGVVVGAGAKILGAITVGAGSRIGANAVVVKSVPPDSVVVGVPGQAISRSQPHAPGIDMEHSKLPDTLGVALTALMDRVEELEKLAGMNGSIEHIPHHPDHSVWHGEDFQI